MTGNQPAPDTGGQDFDPGWPLRTENAVRDTARTRMSLPGDQPTLPGTEPALVPGTHPVAVRVFPGLLEQAPGAYRWARAVIAAGGSGADPDDARLAVAELFANAVLHTRSGGRGGLVTVALTTDALVHVHDFGAGRPCPGLSGRPRAGDPAREDGGRGLLLVVGLCPGVLHMPAAWCDAGGPDDPAVTAAGCCTVARLVPAQRGTGQAGEAGGDRHD